MWCRTFCLCVNRSTIFKYFPSFATRPPPTTVSKLYQILIFFVFCWPIDAERAHTIRFDVKYGYANNEQIPAVFSGTRRADCPILFIVLKDVSNNNIISFVLNNQLDSSQNILVAPSLSHQLERQIKDIRQTLDRNCFHRTIFHRKLSFLLPIKISR